MGPKDPKSTVLTPAEEAIVVEFRRRTLLPLDDVLGCLKDTIPNLSRSALHRCLQRHGISRLPAGEAAHKHKRFKTYEIGYVHMDSCELRHADGKLVMFLAIDRVSKFAYVEFHDHAGKIEGSAFCAMSWRPFPIKSTSCSPTTAWPSPTCPRTVTAPPVGSSDRTSSTASVSNTASSTASPSPIIPGPTAKPSG
jgi:hypothetical protein